MNSKKSFRVSAWRGGTYGLRILRGTDQSKDGHKFFFQFKRVVLLLPNKKVATANITESFRFGTCHELRSAKIGHWLMDEGYAPWAPDPPQKFSLRHVGGNKFEVMK